VRINTQVKRLHPPNSLFCTYGGNGPQCILGQQWCRHAEKRGIPPRAIVAPVSSVVNALFLRRTFFTSCSLSLRMVSSSALPSTTMIFPHPPCTPKRGYWPGVINDGFSFHTGRIRNRIIHCVFLKDFPAERHGAGRRKSVSWFLLKRAAGRPAYPHLSIEEGYGQALRARKIIIVFLIDGEVLQGIHEIHWDERRPLNPYQVIARQMRVEYCITLVQ